MIRKPKIMFMDQPTARFDVRSEAEFLERLRRAAKSDMTIIVSTHRPSLLSLVNRILVFEKGKLVADGPRSHSGVATGQRETQRACQIRSPDCENQCSRSDFAFANDIRAAVELRTPRTSRLILICTLGLFLVGLIWAHFAILDEVKRGNGRVMPTRQIQVVQSLEGGIVGAILVDEGAIVNRGQTLMRIEDTKFASEFGEIRERRAAMGSTRGSA